MQAKLITYDDAIGAVSWADAVEALRAGHRGPRAEVADSFLGPAKGTLLSRGAYIPGLGYGVKSGVNPRIDFWWADFSNRTKAWLDFVLHALLFVPFLWAGLRLLHGYAKTNLGYQRDFSGLGHRISGLAGLLGGGIRGLRRRVYRALGGLGRGIRSLANRIAGAFHRLAGGVHRAFRAALHVVHDLLNRLAGKQHVTAQQHDDGDKDP